MWVYMNDSFLSIIEDKKNRANLVVRARRKKDLLRVFPHAQIYKSRTADYRFRVFMPRREVALAIGRRILKINYTNFKDSVKDTGRHSIYVDVWFSTLPLEPRDDFWLRAGTYYRDNPFFDTNLGEAWDYKAEGFGDTVPPQKTGNMLPGGLS